MQPLTAPALKPADDIEAVLGRFQAWSDFRRPKTPAEDMIDGVRELSYEEALQSSRSRWQARTESPRNNPNQSFVASPEPEPQLEQPPLPIQETFRIDAAFAKYAAFDDEALAPDTVTRSSASESGPDAESPAGTKSPASPPVFGTVLAEAISPDTSPSPDISPRPNPNPSPDPGPLALVWPVPARSERQVSMSLRVAASEQALIKARAAEAGLSASAYLRQCALEVEKLRAQVHHTLAALERGPGQTLDQNAIRSLAAGSPPIQMSPPGFLTRLRQRFFGKSAPLGLRA
jgi:hypothetical protein